MAGQSRHHYSIGELSKRTGVGVPTIRYYGEIGLLAEAGRGAGGHRVYGDEHLKRLTFIRRARELGFSQDDVRALLTSADQHGASCEGVDRLAQEHLQAVRKKISSLQALEAALEQMITSCQGERIESCSIVDSLYQGEAVGC